MRYNDPIYFQRIMRGEYNPDTGDYKPDIVEETMVFADVTDTGIQTMKLVYGTIKKGSKVIRLQTRYEDVYDHIRIGDKVYNVDDQRDLETKQSLIVSEV